MSKRRPLSEYEKTKSYGFFTWLKGEKDPYLDCVEVKPQTEQRLEEVTIQSRMYEKQMMLDKIYDIEHNQEIKWLTIFYKIACVFFCLTLLLVLCITVSYLPPTGSATNPSNNEVSSRYVEQVIEETGALNAVSGMIIQYRGFDTFGETHVLFVATVCVMILLMGNAKTKQKEEDDEDDAYEPQSDMILQMIVYMIAPITCMFGLYVILNGHLSPGGGFSGGAIIGAGIILFACAFGVEETRRFFNEKVYKVVKVTALLIYAMIMGIYFYTGANNISLSIPMGEPGAILSAGLILVINILVGLEVACTMYAFFALFRKGGI